MKKLLHAFENVQLDSAVTVTDGKVSFSSMVTDQLKNLGFELGKKYKTFAKNNRYYLTDITEDGKKLKFSIQKNCNNVDLYQVKKGRTLSPLGRMSSAEKTYIKNFANSLRKKGISGRDLTQYKIQALSKLREERDKNLDKIINSAIDKEMKKILQF